MANPKTEITVWILGDQLLDDHPALIAAEAEAAKAKICVVLIESRARLEHLPYQRKKLVLLLSAMRHYAEALRGRGYRVDYRRADSTAAGLAAHVADEQPRMVITMAAAEYRGRRFQTERLAALLDRPVQVLDNTQFLVGRYDPYPDAAPDKRIIMENFYREMRRHYDLLMTPDGEPEGGAWNFDKENRKPLPKGGLTPPAPVAFPPDEITRQVMADVARLPKAVGAADGFALAVTHAQAQTALTDFLDHRLTDFGPYEDAMSAKEAILFHSVLSPYLNIGLLDPLETVRQAIEAYAGGGVPINSVEGFVRQIVGWREYIYWQYWRQMPAMLDANAWDHHRPMPQLFWDGATEMNCLRHVVERVTETGYTHHIERLMLVCNFCMLAGIDPGAVNDWFLTFYIDAYEWVVTPNVIGMGLNADGGITATKPYIASANYINKMGDYCRGCRYDPKARTGEDACPFNYLYWNFLIEHEDALRANPRSGKAVLGLRHLDEAERARVRRQAGKFLSELAVYQE
jgi:deoxyribodipyrimidine photolyase-related protein